MSTLHLLRRVASFYCSMIASRKKAEFHSGIPHCELQTDVLLASMGVREHKASSCYY